MNDGGYEFSVAGNQIDTSNEPGIVWVMQDVNGNGIPDESGMSCAAAKRARSTPCRSTP